MNVIESYWQAAQKSSEISGVPAEWIYCQWVHESTNVDHDSPDYGKPFCSDLAKEQFNFGGITQEEENDTPMPDGRFYYIKFASLDEYASYFGRYIKKYFPKAAASLTMEEYAYNLKNGEDYEYYGDTYEVYRDGMNEAYSLYFA